MSKLTVPNWFGDIVSHPLVVVEAKTVRGIARILRDTAKYPSPVRAVGSNHSTAACSVADGGTMIKMLGMDRILEVTDETVTVEAGAILVDVAQELKKRNLQFYVNTEIGNLSMGSAACAGTKDGSMPGEFGQVSSYCTRMKMVLPSGKILEASEESDPELMKVLRCSYGMPTANDMPPVACKPPLPLPMKNCMSISKPSGSPGGRAVGIVSVPPTTGKMGPSGPKKSGAM